MAIWIIIEKRYSVSWMKWANNCLRPRNKWLKHVKDLFYFIFSATMLQKSLHKVISYPWTVLIVFFSSILMWCFALPFACRMHFFFFDCTSFELIILQYVWVRESEIEWIKITKIDDEELFIKYFLYRNLTFIG